MFRASLCPSSGEQDRVLPHMVFCTGCADCGWLWLCGAASWAVCTVWKLLFDSNFHTVHTVHTAHNAAPHNHSQPQTTHPGRTTHAVGHGPILLMMGVVCAVCTVWKLLSNSNFQTVNTAHNTAPHNHNQPQLAQPVQNTICGSTRSCSPDDGHNDARNMLR